MTRDGWVVIAWAPYSRRSEMFARELGGTLYCIHNLKFRSKPHAPFKYVIQAVRTLWTLFRTRPAAVHVQDPPFLCPLVVMWYCRLAGAQFVIEYHSAAFEPIWRWGAPLQRRVARRAAANIVTNEHWADVVRSWGGHALVMYDAFLDLPDGEPYTVADGRSVAFACTFADDEPVGQVLEAAARLPDVHFYVTGDTSKADPELVAAASANVTFTGFLDPNGQYLGLLRAVDAVIVLTTRDFTLQLAGCEAVALGKPLITSDWPYLRDLFAHGAVFVEPTAASIRRGVEETLARLEELGAQTTVLAQLRRAEWNERLAELRRLATPDGRRGRPRPARDDRRTDETMQEAHQ